MVDIIKVLLFILCVWVFVCMCVFVYCVHSAYSGTVNSVLTGDGPPELELVMVDSLQVGIRNST